MSSIVPLCLRNRRLFASIFALAILSISAATGFGQNVVTLSDLLAPGGVSLTIPEPPPFTAPGMTVSIDGGVPLETFQVDLKSSTGVTTDKILFSSGAGGPSIEFISFDDLGDVAIPSVELTPLILGLNDFATVTVPVDFGLLGIHMMTATMISDEVANPLLPPGASDLLALSIPEPSSFCLAALGVASLAVSWFCRNRNPSCWALAS